MIMPMIEKMLIVLPVIHSSRKAPTMPSGTVSMRTSGNSHDSYSATSSMYSSTMRQHQCRGQRRDRLVEDLDLTAQRDTCSPAGNASELQRCVMSLATSPSGRPTGVAESDDRVLAVDALDRDRAGAVADSVAIWPRVTRTAARARAARAGRRPVMMFVGLLTTLVDAASADRDLGEGRQVEAAVVGQRG